MWYKDLLITLVAIYFLSHLLTGKVKWSRSRINKEKYKRQC